MGHWGCFLKGLANLIDLEEAATFGLGYSVKNGVLQILKHLTGTTHTKEL